MDTNLSMVPPPTCHQNIPHQPLNIEGFGVGISWGFGLGFFCLLVVVVWCSYIRSITWRVRKQQGGEKKRIHLGRHCMGQAGTELAVLPVGVLAMPPSSENFSFPGQACSKLAGMTVPIHCSKPDISAGSASRQPSPPASFGLQLPSYFEIKRLKKHKRHGVDCLGYVLDAFCPFKNVCDVL